MSSFKQEQQDDMWKVTESYHQTPEINVDIRAITAQVWLSMAVVGIAEAACAAMLGSSFTAINPIAGDVFLGDFIPLPDALADLSMNALINFGLGLACILIPTTIWSQILSDEFRADPRGYFERDPVRMGVGIVLGLTYLSLIALEILALRHRIQGSLYSGPIASPFGSAPPEALPMIVASIAMILGTVLLGLASASLSKSIKKRFGQPAQSNTN